MTTKAERFQVVYQDEKGNRITRPFSSLTPAMAEFEVLKTRIDWAVLEAVGYNIDGISCFIALDTWSRPRETLAQAAERILKDISLRDLERCSATEGYHVMALDLQKLYLALQREKE